MCVHTIQHFKTGQTTEFNKRKKQNGTSPTLQKRICAVCEETAHGMYFGALVCLPCKSFFIRCTRDSTPTFTCLSDSRCDVAHANRLRCQACRYNKCIRIGMTRKEKPETVEPEEGQVLCEVCSDIANGVHFGVPTCEGCKKFFRRALKEFDSYFCKQQRRCKLNPRNRNACRFCRYKKCLDAGMSRTAIRMGRPKKVIIKSGKKAREHGRERPRGPHPWNRRETPFNINTTGNAGRNIYSSKTNNNFSEYCVENGSRFVTTPTFATRQGPNRETLNLAAVTQNTYYYSPYPYSYPNGNNNAHYSEPRHAQVINPSFHPYEEPGYFQDDLREYPQFDTRVCSKPQVINISPQFSISDEKMAAAQKWVSDHGRQISGFGSGSSSPRDESSCNTSVVGTHGSDSSYDIEEDLNVILTSIEQSTAASRNFGQTWSSFYDEDRNVKAELNPYSGEPKWYFPKEQNYSPGPAVNPGSLPPRADPTWRYAYDCGDKAEDPRSQRSHVFPYPTESPPQYPTDSNRATPAPQGLGSQMYSSLLMAYNCSNYQENPTEYQAGRYNPAVPHGSHSGQVYV